MAKKKAKIEKSAADIAYELLEVRGQMNALKPVEKALSDELRKRITAGEQQEYYMLRTDYTLAITDKEKAYTFASANNCVKIDTGLVDKYIKSNRIALPEGYALKASEKLVEVKEDRDVATDGIIIQG